MDWRLALVGLLALLVISNPFDHNSSNQSNYIFFSIRDVNWFGLRRTVELGILQNWIRVPEIDIGCKKQCQNGICILNACYCLSGFYGKKCTWRRSWFVSIVESFFSIAKKTALRTLVTNYSRMDCVLGIPLEWLYYLVPKSNLSALKSTVVWNIGTKLSFLDIILGGMIFGFLYAKLAQLRVITDSWRLLDHLVLNSYALSRRRSRILSLFIYPFYNPFILNFIVNYAMLFENSLALLNELGSSKFYWYLLCLVLITGLGHLAINPPFKSLYGSTIIALCMNFYVAMINSHNDILMALQEFSTKNFIGIVFAIAASEVDLVSLGIGLSVTMIFCCFEYLCPFLKHH